MKRMLINITQREELRVALIDGKKLYNLDIEHLCHKKKSNIYKGTIIRIEPSLEAAFIDYGSCRNGFLPFKEISNKYFCINSFKKIRYNNFLKIGQECIVQVNKEERGDKGVSLTTFVSLVSSYLVLMPHNPHIRGISRKIEGDDRIYLKKLLLLLKCPVEMGLIIRTAGIKKKLSVIQLDLNFQLKRWSKIQKEAQINTAPFLIHRENDIIIRALRDNLHHDVDEILVDNPVILNLVHQCISLLGRFDFRNKVKLYTGENSLFNYYQIESQINSAFQRKVKLPSGGSIVIDIVEALTAIDINSAHSTQGIGIEETALNTNLEAVDEISRQLRLRNLGGLIVIDFIDMAISNHQRLVENRLRNTIQQDRARIQIGDISKFGLLEMSRQRLSSSIRESKSHICSKCNRNEIMKNDKHLSLSVLHLIKKKLFKKKI